MDKKIKTTILALVIYLIVFLIGFKSGAVYLRMYNKVQIERIEMPVAPPPPLPPPIYYIVERVNYGTYVRTTVSISDHQPAIMRFFTNEKLRPLLKSIDVEIYDDNGKKVY